MIIEIIFLTIVFEIIIILGRLYFSSAKEIYKNNKFKYKIRIHHGYIGLIFILIFFLTPIKILLILGIPLLASDFIHHFIVLPLLIKKTEFP